MKKLTTILFAIIIVSCSSSDNGDNGNTSTFAVTVIQDVTTISIDQIVTLTATANETIRKISFSTDGGATFGSERSTNFGTTANLYFDFETIGTRNIVFRVKNENGDTVDNAVTVNVIRGNAIQLLSLQLNSFYNMGETWDPEFNNANPNRLADVFFAILKPRLDVYDGTRSNAPNSSWRWYTSEIRQNETNLNWDMQNENLLINVEELTPYIAFVDNDGGSIGQDLMLGPPFERTIPIADFISTQPNTITIEETDINLEYELVIDW